MGKVTEVPLRRGRSQWDDDTETLNLKLPRTLKEFVADYARSKTTTVSALIRGYLIELREKEERNGP